VHRHRAFIERTRVDVCPPTFTDTALDGRDQNPVRLQIVVEATAAIHSVYRSDNIVNFAGSGWRNRRYP